MLKGIDEYGIGCSKTSKLTIDMRLIYLDRVTCFRMVFSDGKMSQVGRVKPGLKSQNVLKLLGYALIFSYVYPVFIFCTLTEFQTLKITFYQFNLLVC